MVEVAQFPISRLYGHVRKFSPAREEEVIVMQQVMEIYGRENGWDDSTHHVRASNSSAAAGLGSLFLLAQSDLSSGQGFL